MSNNLEAWTRSESIEAWSARMKSNRETRELRYALADAKRDSNGNGGLLGGLVWAFVGMLALSKTLRRWVLAIALIFMVPGLIDHANNSFPPRESIDSGYTIFGWLAGGFLLFLWVLGMIGAGFLRLAAFAFREGKRDYWEKYENDEDEEEYPSDSDSADDINDRRYRVRFM